MVDNDEVALVLRGAELRPCDVDGKTAQLIEWRNADCCIFDDPVGIELVQE
jgi:hypothetical protein